MMKQGSAGLDQNQEYFDYSDRLDVNLEEKARSFHPKVDFLEKALLDAGLSTNSPSMRGSDRQPVGDDYVFTIMDSSTIMPTKIMVSSEEAAIKNVQWLLEQYFKMQLKNPRFDMASVICLRTKNQNIKLDYLLTKNEAKLSLFPQKITLETFHTFPCNQEDSFSCFLFVDLLGYGSFGNVLGVRRKDTGEIFAMKVIPKEKFQKCQAEVYVFEEKNILIEMENLFVVLAFDQVDLHMIFQTNKHIFFVMDFYPGGDLFGLMRDKGTFTEDEARFYMAEIILAMAYLHENLIIYRDLKVRWFNSARKRDARLARPHKAD